MSGFCRQSHEQKTILGRLGQDFNPVISVLMCVLNNRALAVHFWERCYYRLLLTGNQHFITLSIIAVFRAQILFSVIIFPDYFFFYIFDP